MFRSRTTAAEPHTVKIEISDPTAILRALATRYESSTRILMEYVDNSLDRWVSELVVALFLC